MRIKYILHSFVKTYELMIMEKLTIKNKEVNIVFSKEDPTKLRYSNLLLLFYNSEIPKGLTFREMKAHLDFIETLDAASKADTFDIPKDMFEDLKFKVENFKWPYMHKDIIQFSEDILNLQ